jgi:uncharacterized protein with von Willebrand factor type A (vWA) domain
VLGSVDRAAFVVALGERLRRAGVRVTFSALGALTDALGAAPPGDLSTLYWTVRLTLVKHPRDLATFDAVFDAVFREAVLPIPGHGTGPSPADDLLAPVAGRPAMSDEGGGLPWHTLPRVTGTTDDPDGAEDGPVVPELLPSAVAAVADTPFEELDEQQLALIGSWLEASWRRWPTRRSRRRRVHPRGRSVALRETIAASRRTGWEPVELRRTRAVRRPRPVTMVADVSASMQPYATAYLHLMRALARSGRAETFVFSTELTRVTPALRLHSAAEAIAQASEEAEDRYGGTHLAGSLRELLRSRHGHTLRGGVLVVASDGWDSDDPDDLAATLERIRLRVHRLVWLNPRAASPGFEPLVGSMAAALRFCDAFLPAHTARAMTDAVEAVLAD